MNPSIEIGAEHLARACVVYVRQSTLAQTRDNTESLERQYELVERAVGLGWTREQVRVLDTDLGVSGAEVDGREGFKELVAEVALGNVGLVIGIEVSRLARDNSAWYQLLDLCALTGTLIADADGIYDAADYSDRLVLGLKGTISEAELHLIKGRLIAGLRHKAAKGELRIALPAGYDYDPDGAVVISPDTSVREAVAEVFRRFCEHGSIRQVTLSLVDDGLRLPRKRGRRTEWGPATYTAIHDMLLNPTYAGAFAYGRRQMTRVTDPDGRIRSVPREVAREQWRTLIVDHHDGYWSWADYEAIVEQVAANRTVKGQGGGAAREGQSLLQGLVACGRCGRNMHSAYSGRLGRSRRYYCAVRIGQVNRTPECQGLGAVAVDEAVTAEVFKVLEPAAMAATAKALAEVETNETLRLAAFETAAERARYAAGRARRQFDACEPENRLVARSLETVWETALAEVRRAEGELATQRQRRPAPLSDEELAWLSQAGADVRAMFEASTTTQRERKRLLRILIDKVVLTIEDGEADTVAVRICWQGGANTELELPRRRQGKTYRVTDEDTIALVGRLAVHYNDQTIAAVLGRQHRLTATGLRFTKARVAQLRDAHGIAGFAGAVTPPGDDVAMVSVRTAATELAVSPATVYRWLREGFIAGQQPTPGAPWRIRLDDHLRAKVAEDAPAGWLGLNQAAAALGVARQTVLHRVQRGELEAVHVRRGKRKGLRIQVEPGQTGLFDTPARQETQ
ncbi:MAG: recombinase family protein [Jiangellaceae bacterium]